MDAIDLIKLASDGNAVDFTSGIKDMLGARAITAIDQEKQEISKSLFKDEEDFEPSSDYTDDELEQALQDLDNIEVDEFNDDEIEVDDSLESEIEQEIGDVDENS